MVCTVGVKFDRPVVVISNFPSARPSGLVALTLKEVL